ncbi:flavin reductase family protein [Gordonia terrae]|uniref:flavin reductase family protein n=1 Tax=Gordonia hongkongensis TaxID=1701090 RepID=UPI0022B32F03|nr:flavin reductase family protein [Gordonia terrae]
MMTTKHVDPQPMTVGADDYRTIFGDHPAGVAVITADAGDGPAGLTATSVASVSATPPMIVFSLSTSSSAAPTIAAAETVVVHMISSAQMPVALTFATSGIDRFAEEGSWTRLETGEPLLLAATRWMRGRIVSRVEAGAATVVTVEVLEVHVDADAIPSAPLVYHARAWHTLGDHSRVS